MRYLCVLLLLVCSASLAFAGTVTFTFGGTPVTLTTTAAQDAFLTRLLGKENQLRASKVPPQAAISLETFMRNIFTDELQERKTVADTYEETDFCIAFNAASAATRNATIAQYGNNSPCP